MSIPATDEWGLVRSDQEETEESYFISMTDIMVGLLFIFIIMLMAFGLMLKVAEEKTKVAKENTEKTRDDIKQVVEQSRKDVRDMLNIDLLRNKMLHDIENKLSKRGVTVKVREENGVLQLPDEILFDKAKDDLNEKGLRAIRALAWTLDQILPCYAVVPPNLTGSFCAEKISDQLRLEAIFVEGHTDTDGDQEYNWRLSANRAINTYRALERHSKVATKLLNDQDEYLFSVAGYGENRELIKEVDADTKEALVEAQRQNRRIDLRFVINVSHKDALLQVQSRLEKVLKQP